MAAASPNLGTGPTNQQGPSPQTGSTTPTGQVIGPLPASTMPGQLAQAIPTMANFQFLLAAVNTLQTEINNITPGGNKGTVTEIDTSLPITGGPITTQGTVGHAISGVIAGTYGNSTNVPQTTVDQFGHVTSIVNVPFSSGGSVSITATSPIVVTPSPITGTGVVSHAASGVTPGTYGDVSDVAQITVEADGHITAVTNIPIPGIGGKWLFGDGSDGSFTADGSATPAWATLAGSVYTMTRNAYLINLTVNAGVTIDEAGFQIWCNGTLTGVNATTSIIECLTASATTQTGVAKTYNAVYGAAGTSSVGSGGNGQTGIAAVVGSPTVGIALGGVGGAGGNGQGTGAAGGGLTTALASQGSLHSGGIISAVMWGRTLMGALGNSSVYTGGAGGGGGGKDIPGHAGGGGGAGGFICGVLSRFIAGVGIFKARGGDGAPGQGGNSSGGGAGGGGAVMVMTQTTNWASLWTTDVTGGTGGTASGASGANGVNGSPGSVWSFIPN
jgi:hypothetical protein